MKMQLASCNCTNIEELKGEMVRLWTTRMSDSDYLRNLVDLMPRRLQEVIDSGGASTRYYLNMNMTLYCGKIKKIT